MREVALLLGRPGGLAAELVAREPAEKEGGSGAVMDWRGIGVAWSVWSPGGEREPNPNPNPNGFSLFVFAHPIRLNPSLPYVSYSCLKDG